MYKRVETDNDVWWGGVAMLEALVTLENEDGKRAHWVRDGNDYVLLVEAVFLHTRNCYKASDFIFPEAANALADIINHERWSRASIA